MKKIKNNLLRISTTVMVLMLLISCSGDDSNSNSSSSINPPSWIIGTWINDDLGYTYGFKFAKDDFCLMNLNMTTCFKEALKLDAGTGLYDVYEEKTDNSYYIEIKYGVTTYSYEFTKISSTEIETYDPTGGSITLTKQ